MTYQKPRVAATLLAGCLFVFGGCESDGSSMSEFFPKENRALQAFADKQAELGAAADAMLRPQHFDGPELNALGREKLDMMTAGRPEAATTVYMNFAEKDMMDQRRDAVVAYLGSKGITEGMLKFVSGPNPDATSPAAGHLARLNRTESFGTTLTNDPGSMTGSTDGQTSE